jgi:AraC-like DNA-binding protein
MSEQDGGRGPGVEREARRGWRAEVAACNAARRFGSDRGNGRFARAHCVRERSACNALLAVDRRGKLLVGGEPVDRMRELVQDRDLPREKQGERDCESESDVSEAVHRDGTRFRTGSLLQRGTSAAAFHGADTSVSSPRIRATVMRYEEFPPPPDLARHVRCAWVFEAAPDPAAPPQRIVPDGRCELVIHGGDAFAESGLDGVERIQPRVLFAGQLSRPLWLRATGRAEVYGVRFHPAGARRFLGMPLAKATDRRLEMGAMLAIDDGRPAIDAAYDFVRQRIALSPSGDDAAIATCAAWLEERRGLATIEEMVGMAGLGRRQFERRFRDAVGLSPRLFSNVLRLRSVFDALEANPAAGWTDAALAAGYFDHSHLIRDFRRFVGCTPAQFLATTPGLATALV